MAYRLVGLTGRGEGDQAESLTVKDRVTRPCPLSPAASRPICATWSFRY